MAEQDMSRRDFVRTTAGAAAGAALSTAAASQADAAPQVDTSTILNYNPKMGYRRFGKTGVMISEMSLGGHWKNRTGGRYWASFPNDNPPPDVQMNRNQVWVKAAELGINYYDITTAGEAAIYGRCAKMTGVKLHIGYSDHVLCIRGANNRTVDKMMYEIDQGLRRLMVDQMFLWRPQANTGGGHDERTMDNVVETYYKAKKQGKVQYLGMSAHNRTWVAEVLRKYGEHYHGFVFMLGVHDVPRVPSEKGGLFDVVKEKDIGTVGLKPFHGNGYFRAVIREARKKGEEPDCNRAAILGLKKILESFPYLTATIPGMTTVDEVENNVKASYGRKKKLAEAERREVDHLAALSLENLPWDYTWIRQQAAV
jgi:aryl-alcohol dehydrogenase-like predicted oxidoreductase